MQFSRRSLDKKSKGFKSRSMVYVLSRILMVVALLVGLFPAGLPVAFAAPTLSITKTASTNTVAAGQNFTYSFAYRCASSAEDCLNATFDDTLPPELSSLTADVVALSLPDVQAGGFHYNQATRQIHIDFVTPLTAGKTGVIQVQVKFPNGTTPNGTQASNVATFSASNAGSVTSNPPTVVTATANNNWTVTKTVSSPTAWDTNITYTVKMCPPATGALWLTNAQMVDTLPVGANYVSASGSPTVSGSTVTWSYAGPLTACQQETVVVIFPYSASTPNPAVNNVVASGIPFGQSTSVSVGSAAQSSTLVISPNITSNVAATKTVSSANVPQGTTAYYTLSAANNNTFPLNSFVLDDYSIPSQSKVDSFTTGPNSVAQPVTITYKTTNSAGAYISTGLTNPYTGGAANIDVTTLGLALGETITAIRWDYGTVPGGFSVPAASGPRINFTGQATTGSIQNCAKVTWNYAATNGNTSNKCVNYTATTGYSATVTKTQSSSTIPLGTTGSYTISGTNTGVVSVDNFTIQDNAIPSAVTLSSITTGNSTQPVTISFKTNNSAGVYITTGLTNPYAAGANTTITIASLGLPGTDYITAIRWNYGTVAAGFTPTTAPTINFSIPTTNPAGGTVAIGDSVQNCAQVNYDVVAGTQSTGTSCQTFTVTGPTIAKAVSNTNIAIQGTGSYTLTPNNTTGNSLNSFTVTDDPISNLITINSFTTSNSSVPVTISYKTNTSAGYITTGLTNPYPAGTNATITVASLSLTAGDYITGIKWDFGTVPANFTPTTNPAINFTVPSTTDAATVVPNCAALTWTPGQPTTAPSACKNFTVTGVGVNKTVTNATIAVGGTNSYTVWGTTPNGGSSLDNFVVEDSPLPSQITLTSVSPGGTVAKPVTLSYATNLNASYTTLGTYNNNTAIPIASFSLAGGEYITGLRWNYGTVAINFNPSSANRPVINFTVNSTDPAGNNVVPGTITNCDRIRWTVGGVADNSSDKCVNFTLNAATANPTATKTRTSSMLPGGYFPGDVINFRLTVANNAGSTGTLDNPVLMDLLPSTLNFVATPAPGYTVTVVSGVTGPSAPSNFQVLPNYGSTGRTLLRWNWTGTSVQAGGSMYVDIALVVAPGAAAGTVSNTMSFTSNVSVTNCATTDTNDLDGDSSTTDKLCTSTDSSTVIASSATLSSSKLVKGQLDSAYSYAGFTIPGGTGDYSLTITNTGNIPIKNIEIMDILPFVGDVGVIDLVSRGTQWRPNLIGAVSVPAGITVYYSTQSNPCRPELVPSGPAGCSPANWSTTFPADPTSVQSIKFDFGSIILNPGENRVLGWPMRAPVGTTPGTLAWNSFGYVGTRTDNNQTLLPSEPVKVSIQVNASSAASYGDFVWIDANHNGIQDTGESGINGVQVQLYQPGGDGAVGGGDDVLVSTTVTGNDSGGNPGYYLFPGLPAGQYFAKFTLPNTSYVFSPLNAAGSTTANDSDANPLTATTAVTAITDLAAGEADLSWDAGIYLPAAASLGNRVWYDVDHNGIQDTGETGVQGVLVTLYDSGGGIVGTDTTDPSGIYGFPSLTPGTYSVAFSNLPANYIFTTQNASGSTGANNSDPDATTGKTAQVTLAAGENNPDLDAGIHLPLGVDASLGNRVWYDLNHNGIQDTGELGVSGVTVTLYDSGNNNIGTTTTNSSGIYGFANLAPGTYSVGFSNLPTSYVFTTQNAAGGTSANNSDADTSTGKTAPVTLAAGDNYLDLDAGIYIPSAQPASLGNRVWYDLNQNGIQDSGELGVASVTVTLYDGSNNALATTTTDGSGIYGFSNLAPGSYSVGFSNLPASYVFTAQNAAGGTGANNSDANTSTGKTAAVTLAAGENNPDLDAGIYIPSAQPASLGNRVWYDLNLDGIQDTGETGVAGVTVTLYDSAGTAISTTSTDSSGIYGFSNLAPGTYSVGFSNLPASYVFSTQNAAGSTGANNSDPDTTTGKTAQVTLAAGETNPDLDAGIHLPAGVAASLGNRVWYDLNQNGNQDSGELGVAGVTVTLYNSGGTVITSMNTDSSGIYGFSNLAPGTYSVGFSNLPASYVFTAQNAAGSTGANNSDANTSTGKTAQVTLAAGENNPDLDAGIYIPSAQPASLGNRVWYDLNQNGIQDSGELGVSGVTVTLYDGSNNALGTTTTDGSGIYSFSNLAPGSYSVGFSNLPSSYVFTSQNASGSTSANNSDANTSTGKTAPVTLAAGENNPDLDAGIYTPSAQPASLGNRVWYDLNQNGVQDTGELGVSGVTVTLYNSVGTAISSMNTDNTGIYGFSNLAPGSYSVGFSNLPTSYVLTTQNAAGGTGATNSDPDTSTGKTASVTLAAGENNPDLDAGIYIPSAQPASLGNKVWYDLNHNGIQDSGELGVPGVTVTLYDSTNNALATTTTDGSGIYGFANLAPGSYSVSFTNLPASYVLTTQNATGSTGANNSDPDASTGRTAAVTLAAGENNPDLDAGIYIPAVQPASLGNRVWYDLNQNGIQDSGELGVSGVTVTLYNAGGTPISSMTTDSNGIYGFSNLAPGTYSVGFSNLPTSYVFTSLNAAGSTGANNSDANTSTGKTSPVTLAASENNPDLDAGIYIPSAQPASLGNKVWYDLNRNGIQDSGEGGVPGVTVTLYDSTGTPIALTTTDGSGIYGFSNLAPGTYSVGFSNLPASYVLTTQNASGSTGANNSDPDASTGRTATVTLAAGENNPDLDAGIYLPVGVAASLGNRVWYDTNRNGIQDAGENGVPNVTVTLYNAGGTAITSMPTDSSGIYTFANLLPGTYSVGFSNLPSGYVLTTQNANGSTGATNSDANTSTGRTAAVTLAAGENNPDLDAGIYVPSTPSTPNPTPNPTPTTTPSPTTTSPGAPTTTPDPSNPTGTPDPSNPSVTPNPSDPTGTPDPSSPSVTPDPSNPTTSPAGGVPTAVVKVDPYIVKTVDKNTAIIGDIVNFNITVTNPGPNTAEKIVVTDAVPLPFAVKNATTSQGTVNVSGQNVTVNIGTLLPGQSINVLVTTQVVAGVVGSVTNKASLTCVVTGTTTGSETSSGNREINSTSDVNLTIVDTKRLTGYPGLPNTGLGANQEDSGWGLIPLLVIGLLLLGGSWLLRRKVSK